MFNIITRSPEETIAFAEKIGKLLRGGDIIAYRGGLGAGKTTFTRGIAVGIYDFDMYRIMNAESLETTGFYDYISDDSVIVCEWSENIADCLPENIITVTIEAAEENVRKITVEGDERFDTAGDRHVG